MCVCVSMYSCSTFKLFDEKMSCLHRAEYESLYKRTDAEENIIFVRKVFESVSVLWVFNKHCLCTVVYCSSSKRYVYNIIH